MHKLGLALAAALLIGGLVLFAARWTSHAPEKVGNESKTSPYARAITDESKVIDLTYDFDNKTIYWPTAQAFRWQKESWGKSKGGYWYTAARYSGSEHGGTHIDWPIHFGWGRGTTGEIPLAGRVSPAIVFDISTSGTENPDSRVPTN